ncbi:MAG: endolytic transglycosylase MltG [Treponema sp.]
MKKNKLFLLLLFVPIFGIVAFLPKYLDSPVDLTKKDVTSEFRVDSGETLRHVIERLKAENLIRSKTYALIYAKWKNYSIKMGIYDFSPSFKTHEILLALAKGGREEILKITIPEGLTIKKTAHIFAETGLFSAEDFIKVANDATLLKETGFPFKTAEGFLFPDTYFLTKKDTAEKVLKMMLKNFLSKIESVSNFPKGSEEMYKKVCLASIIEREYQLDEEAPVIAGVFTNRLNIKMPLQSCATVEYIITELQGKPHPKRLFWDDIQIENEYNTYVHQGLPPSPIANPGLVSLKAACNPQKNNYLYFRLVDAKIGRHAFSTNVRDHNKIGNVYLLKK